MNRKHKNTKRGIALVLSMSTLNLSAQTLLIGAYQSDRVGLGMGVEQSQMLTTAPPWKVVSGDELQKRLLFL